MSLSRRTAITGMGAAMLSLTSPTVASAGHHRLALPRTSLAREATRLMVDLLEPHLRNHSVRGYLFGRAVAESQGLKPGADYDDENMYLICVLHDIGLSDAVDGDQRFEIDGADYAARFLEENGVDDGRVDLIWDAIAAHTSGFSSSPVYRRRRPAEIWIAVDGIGIDVAGSASDLPDGFADLVHTGFPRLGGSRALTRSIETQALANPLKAPPATLPGEIVHQRHPDLPYMTWDMILDSSGWAD